MDEITPQCIQELSTLLFLLAGLSSSFLEPVVLVQTGPDSGIQEKQGLVWCMTIKNRFQVRLTDSCSFLTQS